MIRHMKTNTCSDLPSSWHRWSLLRILRKYTFPITATTIFTMILFTRKQESILLMPRTLRPVSKLPVFVKAGSIIPMHKIIQSTNDDPGDTLFINLYKGDEVSTYTYYEDDGISFGYREGQFYKRRFSYDGKNNNLIIDPAEGNYPSHYKFLKLRLHGYNTMPSSIAVQYGSKKGMPQVNNLDMVVENDPGRITVTWK